MRKKDEIVKASIGFNVVIGHARLVVSDRLSNFHVKANAVVLYYVKNNRKCTKVSSGITWSVFKNKKNAKSRLGSMMI